MPVNEPRQVVVGEGRLLARDRVQRHTGLGDDLLTVAPRDLPMLACPLGAFPPLLAARPGRPDLGLRLQVDPLRLQRPVIDPRLDPKLGHALVNMLGPALSPALQHLPAVPLPRFLAETRGARFAHRQHDVGVRLGLAVRAHVPMHIQVRDHAAIHELPLHEIARQLHTLGLAYLPGNRELHLPGKLGVFSLLQSLDLVPQGLAVLPALGRSLWRHDLRMHDAGLVAEVVVAFQPLVVQPRGRTVGARGHGAGPVGAADHLGAEMVDRHRRLPCSSCHPFSSARRHDV